MNDPKLLLIMEVDIYIYKNKNLVNVILILHRQLCQGFLIVVVNANKPASSVPSATPHNT